MEIKPIETQYKGYRFRSRLEARWAVFFDVIGLEWEYEREGYELEDGTRYLPDFWIPLIHDLPLDWGFYVEIKPVEPTDEERNKLHLLAKNTGHTVYCFWGKPGEEGWFATVYLGQRGGELWIKNGEFNFKDLTFDSTAPEKFVNGYVAYKFKCTPFGYRWEINPQKLKMALLRKGFEAFRSARFEFGEEG